MLSVFSMFNRSNGIWNVQVMKLNVKNIEKEGEGDRGPGQTGFERNADISGRQKHWCLKSYNMEVNPH